MQQFSVRRALYIVAKEYGLRSQADRDLNPALQLNTCMTSGYPAALSVYMCVVFVFVVVTIKGSYNSTYFLGIVKMQWDDDDGDGDGSKHFYSLYLDQCVQDTDLSSIYSSAIGSSQPRYAVWTLLYLPLTVSK